MTVEFTHEGIDLEVEYKLHRGEGEVRTLSNGDPGTPAAPDSLDVLKVQTPTPEGMVDITHLIHAWKIDMESVTLNHIE